MGSSTSKYEVDMPPLPVIKPVGVLPEYTTRTEPIRLEFGKSSNGVSLIKEVDSGEVVFEVEEMVWGKTRLCERRAGKVKGRVLLNIYSSALSWNWDIKGDNIEQSQTKVKPFLFKIKCETGRRPVIRIKFSVGGKKLTWRLEPDEQRASILVMTEGRTMLGHAGMHQTKSFPEFSGFVLTVAPGVDYAMITTAFLCRTQYLKRSNSHHGGLANAGGNTGAIAASIAGGGGGGGGGGC